MKTKLQSEENFLNNLVQNFPELSEEILDEDYVGLINLQIGCFTRFTQKAIDSNDSVVVKRCLNFVDNNINHVVFKIENSLFLTYLARLKFNRAPHLAELMPIRLKEAIDQIEQRTTSDNENLHDFLKNNNLL